MNTTITKAITTGGLILATTLGLTACVSGSASSSTSVSRVQACNSPSKITPSTPTIAILGQTGPGISYYAPDVATILNSASQTKAHVIVNGVGNDASPRWGRRRRARRLRRRPALRHCLHHSR